MATTDARAEWIGGSKSSPTKSETWSQQGVASWYGTGRLSKRSANGERFDCMAMTAAHPYLPFGTRVRVIDASTGREIEVTITDRLPSARRVIDLSLGAARALGIIQRGTAEVTLVRL